MTLTDVDATSPQRHVHAGILSLQRHVHAGILVLSHHALVPYNAHF